MKKRMLMIGISTLILLNIVACFHAYRFTHFGSPGIQKTKTPEKLSWGGKLLTVISGVQNPRPENKKFPGRPFKTIKLRCDKTIECWVIPVENSKGTIAVFHGFSGNKASMLDKSEIFNSAGYSTLLVDFRGSGGSEGNQTTVGFFEAREVIAVYNQIRADGEKNIILFGTSMGAAAIMKAIHDASLRPSAIILECPFGTMMRTVQARFEMMRVPTFPMSHLLVFWGGTMNNFNAFRHNPEMYAESIRVPTLLLHGQQDKNVSMEEIRMIYRNLKGRKELRLFENAGHENYLHNYTSEWTDYTIGFLENLKSAEPAGEKVLAVETSY